MNEDVVPGAPLIVVVFAVFFSGRKLAGSVSMKQEQDMMSTDTIVEMVNIIDQQPFRRNFQSGAHCCIDAKNMLLICAFLSFTVLIYCCMRITYQMRRQAINESVEINLGSSTTMERKEILQKLSNLQHRAILEAVLDEDMPRLDGFSTGPIHGFSKEDNRDRPPGDAKLKIGSEEYSNESVLEESNDATSSSLHATMREATLTSSSDAKQQPQMVPRILISINQCNESNYKTAKKSLDHYGQMSDSNVCPICLDEYGKSEDAFS